LPGIPRDHDVIAGSRSLDLVADQKSDLTVHNVISLVGPGVFVRAWALSLRRHLLHQGIATACVARIREDDPQCIEPPLSPSGAVVMNEEFRAGHRRLSIWSVRGHDGL